IHLLLGEQSSHVCSFSYILSEKHRLKQSVMPLWIHEISVQKTNNIGNNPSESLSSLSIRNLLPLPLHVFHETK
ncbi:MAG: hypothetical protein LBI30_01385, partial [Holosporales bacterium]|nr:hypothetical protein [Holosporales bacterium]